MNLKEKANAVVPNSDLLCINYSTAFVLLVWYLTQSGCSFGSPWNAGKMSGECSAMKRCAKGSADL
jgi:hypothetical protein